MKTSTTAPSTPDFTCTPNANPAISTSTDSITPRTRSAVSRPQMIELRRIGATSSLSK